MFYKFNESLTQIVEDTSLYEPYYAAHIYSEMQDRIFLILSKDKSLLQTAYDMFLGVIESETGSTETAFDEFDKFIKDNNLIYLDSEVNLDYDILNRTANNTETGEVYNNIDLALNYSARF